MSRPTVPSLNSLAAAQRTAAGGSGAAVGANGIWKYVLVGGSIVAVATGIALIRRYRQRRANELPSRAFIGERHLGGRIGITAADNDINDTQHDDHHNDDNHSNDDITDESVLDGATDNNDAQRQRAPSSGGNRRRKSYTHSDDDAGRSHSRMSDHNNNNNNHTDVHHHAHESSTISRGEHKRHSSHGNVNGIGRGYDNEGKEEVTGLDLRASPIRGNQRSLFTGAGNNVLSSTSTTISSGNRPSTVLSTMVPSTVLPSMTASNAATNGPSNTNGPIMFPGVEHQLVPMQSTSPLNQQQQQPQPLTSAPATSASMMVSTRGQQLLAAAPLPYMTYRRRDNERNGILMVALLLLIAVLLMIIDGRTAIISPLLGIYMRSLITRQSDKDDDELAPTLASNGLPLQYAPYVPISSVAPSATPLPMPSLSSSMIHAPMAVAPSLSNSMSAVSNGNVISPVSLMEGKTEVFGDGSTMDHIPNTAYASLHVHDQQPHDVQVTRTTTTTNTQVVPSTNGHDEQRRVAEHKAHAAAERERRQRHRAEAKAEAKAERQRRLHDDEREREWFQPVLSAPVIDSSPAIVTIEYEFAYPWHHVVAQYWNKELPFDAATYVESPDDEFAVFRHIDKHMFTDMNDNKVDLRTKAGRPLGGKTLAQVTQDNLTSELYYVVMDQLIHYTGRIYTTREMRIINKLGAKGGLMGVPAGTTHLVQLEYSVVDPATKSFRIRSINREFRKVIVATDEREYAPHPDRPLTHTRFTQRCQVGLSFLLRYLKTIGAGVLERKAKKNNEDFNLKLSRMSAAGVFNS